MKTFKQFLNENVGALKTAGKVAAIGLSSGGLKGGVEILNRKTGLANTLASGINAIVPTSIMALGASPAEEERKASETIDPTVGKIPAILDTLGFWPSSEVGDIPTIESREREEARNQERKKDEEFLASLSPEEKKKEQTRRFEQQNMRRENAAKVQETMKRLDQIRGVFTDEQ